MNTTQLEITNETAGTATVSPTALPSLSALPDPMITGLIRVTPEQYTAVQKLLKAPAPPPLQLPAPEPAPEPISEGTAKGLFALIEKMESETQYRKAPLVEVLRLYCNKHMTRAQIAKKCRCVPSLITLRLQQIEKKLGCKPAQLRQLSSHIEAIEDSLTDSRARKINRRNLEEEIDSEENEY